MSTTDEVIPSARRLVRSLRDMGYDFTTAVADLVDNSLEANATLVSINVEFEGDNSWVRVSDNGKGMTENELIEAMRYGSDREYNERSLGKFGLGLKTASMSQCQRLTVASRTDPNNTIIVARCWDFEYIEKYDRWEVLRIAQQDLDQAIRTELEKNTGTVIFWQKLDRILGYKHPYGEKARRRLFTMCRDLEIHLAMVFHKFLNGEILGRHLRIFLNGNEIKGWDPFARDEAKTQRLVPHSITCEYEDAKDDVILEPYILPPRDDFFSRDAWETASGPKKWNQQQGFYVYRNGRMIQSGGWSRLRTQDEHTKLARIALYFSPILDDAFKINVSKMRVYLPAQIRDEIEAAIEPVVRLARITYDNPSSRSGQTGIRTGNARTHATATTDNDSNRDLNENPISMNTGLTYRPKTKQTAFDIVTLDNADNSEPSINSDEGLIANPRLWTLDQLTEKIKEIAEPDELPVVIRVFHRLRDNLRTPV